MRRQGAPGRIAGQQGCLPALPVAWLALLLTCSALAGCRRTNKVPTDALPVYQVSREDILNEKARAEKGEPVGDALRRPQIVLDSRGVLINGRFVASHAEVFSDQLGQDRASDWLRGLREHWKEIQAGRSFDGVVQLSVSKEIDASVALRMLANAGTIGYAKAQVRVGEEEWEAALHHPRVSCGDWEGGPPSLRNLTLRGGVGGYELCAGAASPPKAEELRAMLSTTCAGVNYCTLRLSPAPGPFAVLATILKEVFRPGAPSNLALDVQWISLEDAGVDPCTAPQQMGEEPPLTDAGRSKP